MPRLMPRKTFENLREDKKNRVLEAGLEEFSQKSFHQATVRGIVERAGISKGSFYQYFEDKKDFYRYLIELSQERKINFMRDVLEKIPEKSVFAKLKELYRAGFRFAKKNPRLLAVGQNLLKEDEELRGELLGETAASGEDFIIQILQEGVEAGEIDPEADLSVAASMMVQYNLNLIDVFLQTPLEKGAEESLPKIDEMIYILKNGLSQ